MTYISSPCAPSRRRPSLLALVRERLALLRQRRSLRSLDCAALKDIGISKEDALKEADRPIWDAPANWTR